MWRLFTQCASADRSSNHHKVTSVDTSMNADTACFHRIRSHLVVPEKRIRGGIPLDEASSSDVGGCTSPLLHWGARLRDVFPPRTVLDMFGWSAMQPKPSTKWGRAWASILHATVFYAQSVITAATMDI